MYAVIGVSGNTGSVVARTLLERGERVRAVVRRAEAAAALRQQGAEVAVADLSDPDALASALAGVDGAYVMTPPLLDAVDPAGERRGLIRSIRQGVARAGSPPLVMLSSAGAHLAAGTGPVLSLRELEQALTDYDGPLTMLRAPFFLDNWAENVTPATDQAVFPSMMAEGVAIDMASTADIASTAAELLLERRDGHGVVELHSSRLYGAADVAAALGELLGQPLTVVYPPRGEWADILTGAGLSTAGADQMAELFDGINSGHVGFSGEGERRTAAEGPAAMFERLLNEKAA